VAPADPFAPLERYGFDRALFAAWQRAVADGRLSRQNNVVTGDLRAPPPRTIAQLPAAPARAELARRGGEAIAQGGLGIVVLNGGMATRFGGVVKGVVDVLGGGRTFLGLLIEDVRRAQQQHGGLVQVFLMNSFATDASTRVHLEQHRHFGLDPAQIHHFTQFVAVRMQQDGAVFRTGAGELSPYGPGHGDFPAAFRRSGLLQRFVAGGGRWLLVRNVDNLGARVDAAILGHHLQSGAEVTVELVPKRADDVGGAPYLLDDRVQLVEQLRYPEGFRHDIVDVFNCNTFTFNAAALDRDFDLGWYFVEKTVDGRKAVQIEHLVGEVTRWLATNWLRVARTGPDTRFLPVKTPEDLAAARAEIAAIYGDGPPPAL
jgi:UTP--glucose-1-phosphate uridylyltransferase